MSVEPIIADSARKHGVSDDDMLHAYRHPMRVFELDEGFTMVIGANQAASSSRSESLTACKPRARDACAREVPEVRTVPRSVQEILDHASELAARFEEYEPAADDERDPAAYVALRDAVLSRSAAERGLHEAVDEARSQGYSWAFIGSIVGTSGEAARQRYGRSAHRQP